MAQSEYFVGQVANLLSACHSTSTADTDSNKRLTNLFSVDSSPASLKKKMKKKKCEQTGDTVTMVNRQPTAKRLSTKVTKDQMLAAVIKEKSDTSLETVDKKPGSKKKKRNESVKTAKKQHAGKNLSDEDLEIGYSPPEGIIHESLLQQQTTYSDSHKSKKRKIDDDSESEEDSNMTKKKKMKHERDTTKDSRTIFVGNVATTVTKKDLKKKFSKYGEIENLRFRCPPTSDPKKSKKLVVIKHDFHPDRHNMIAYVCFKEESSARNALSLNGHLLQGLHLRVDLSSDNTEHNSNRSVFVGNLPFSLEEEDLRNHFRKCGKIENVRIIRDNKTGIGKGFGYVQFKEQSTVSIALMLKSSQLGGREIRVMRCTNTPEETKMSKENPARRRITQKGLHKKFKPANKAFLEKKKENSFKGIQINNEKFKMRTKKNMKGQSHSGRELKHKKDTRKHPGKLHVHKRFNRNK